MYQNDPSNHVQVNWFEQSQKLVKHANGTMSIYKDNIPHTLTKIKFYADNQITQAGQTLGMALPWTHERTTIGHGESTITVTKFQNPYQQDVTGDKPYIDIGTFDCGKNIMYLPIISNKDQDYVLMDKVEVQVYDADVEEGITSVALPWIYEHRNYTGRDAIEIISGGDWPKFVTKQQLRDFITQPGFATTNQFNNSVEHKMVVYSNIVNMCNSFDLEKRDYKNSTLFMDSHNQWFGNDDPEELMQAFGKMMHVKTMDGDSYSNIDGDHWYATNRYDASTGQWPYTSYRNNKKLEKLNAVLECVNCSAPNAVPYIKNDFNMSSFIVKPCGENENQRKGCGSSRFKVMNPDQKTKFLQRFPAAKRMDSPASLWYVCEGCGVGNVLQSPSRASKAEHQLNLLSRKLRCGVCCNFVCVLNRTNIYDTENMPPILKACLGLGPTNYFEALTDGEQLAMSSKMRQALISTDARTINRAIAAMHPLVVPIYGIVPEHAKNRYPGIEFAGTTLAGGHNLGAAYCRLLGPLGVLSRLYIGVVVIIGNDKLMDFSWMPNATGADPMSSHRPNSAFSTGFLTSAPLWGS